MWTADATYYLTADGRAVPAGDPAGVRLLVTRGGQLPLVLAQQYGLTTEGKAVTYPPANKALRGPQHTKGLR